MTEDRYYASVFGGQVCRDCGAVVLGIAEHDEFHERFRELERPVRRIGPA